jgi:transposase
MNSHPLQQLPLHPPVLEGELLLSSVVQMVTLTQQEHTELKWQGEYWKVQHTRSIAREEALKEELKERDATIRDLKQRLYGKKSEKGGSKADLNPNTEGKNSKRPRGQQKGSVSHGRTVRPNLLVIPEVIPLSETACGICGLEYSLLADEESEIIEIEVAAHVRRIKRQKCAKNCMCVPGSKFITAPAPPKLIPRSPYGNSIWEEILLNKFLHAQPVNRTLNDFKSLGLTISPGTIADNLKKLTPLFEPVYKAFHQQQMTENRFHNDETRWEVYEKIEGKTGHRWYLWLTRSISVVYYRMDPTRSADVPITHFADLISKIVIVICDRYSAYKKLARLNLAIILAFCWAHVRRDFLDLARSHADLNKWGLNWAEDISKLFHLNNQRIALWDPSLPLIWQSPLFKERHDALGTALNEMKLRCDALLEANKTAVAKKEKTADVLAPAKRSVLLSLQNHWKGLMVFYDYPDVKMDNNPAEQSMRNPVLGRNGYYGSGSLSSAELAAMMFSIFQTMLLWNLNPRTWLHLYFGACAQNGGKSPDDLSEFLPWTMSAERRQKLSKPPDNNTS